LEIINKISRDDLIESNLLVVVQKIDELDRFIPRYDVIDEVLKIFDNVDYSVDRSGVIKKASYLMGAISWAQPFGAGNKRTALLVSATYLHQNGIEVKLIDDKELRKLLYEIQEQRSSLQITVIEEIIFYISKIVDNVWAKKI